MLNIQQSSHNYSEGSLSSETTNVGGLEMELSVDFIDTFQLESIPVYGRSLLEDTLTKHKFARSNPSSQSPFHLQHGVRWKATSGISVSEVVDPKTGEIGRGEWSYKRLVDSDKFVKIFERGLQVMHELDSAGFSVFLILVLELMKEGARAHDTVRLSYSRNLGFGHTKFVEGINSLINSDVIYPHVEKHRYFYNLNLVANGNRDAIMKRSKKYSNSDSTFIPSSSKRGHHQSNGQQL